MVVVIANEHIPSVSTGLSRNRLRAEKGMVLERRLRARAWLLLRTATKYRCRYTNEIEGSSGARNEIVMRPDTLR